MKAHDEVCGMTIDVEKAATHVEFQGRTYYFCTERCREKFVEHPDWYVPVPADGPGGNPPEGAGEEGP